MPRLILVDGHSVAFRAHYALPDSIRGGDGAPANAFYGFFNIVFRVLQDHAPTHLAVTFDLGRPQREDLYAGYKAQRTEGPEDLEPQVAKVRTVLTAFGIPYFEQDGFEADDLLATLTRQARASKLEVDVLSGDLDILQLVRPGVRVIAPGKTFSVPIVYDVAAVTARYGIGPERLRDWKSLVGDASDAIPGVRGVGAKSATALLQRFADLDAIYSQLDAVEPPRLRAALSAGRDAAILSRSLVQLRDDAPIQLDAEASALARFERERGVRALRDLGFETLPSRVPPFA
jgi:DNA polymerase-1